MVSDSKPPLTILTGLIPLLELRDLPPEKRKKERKLLITGCRP
jgi:hypothetical protein